jgi:predicted  nucleic acid-binding Zn-ribbon protein
MLASIGANTSAIEGLTTRMGTAEGDIDALEGRASGVEGRMTTAEGEIDTLQGEMSQAKTDITNLGTNKLDASVFNSFNNGTSKSVSEIEADIVAKANAAQAGAESTAASELASAVGTINGKIAALEGADSALDGKISTNATNIQTNATNITNEETARKAADDLINEKFGAEYSKTSTVASAIADAKKSGTDAAGVASSNTGRIAAIEGDYLKAADFFFIDCGTATEVIEEIPASMKR